MINDTLSWAIGSLTGALANIGECQRLLAAEAAKPALTLDAPTLRAFAKLADLEAERLGLMCNTFAWRNVREACKFLADELEARDGKA